MNFMNLVIQLFVTWDVAPEIFHIGSFSLRWYTLLFAMAFVLGYFILRKIFQREGVSLKLIDRLSLYMLLGTVIGARLGHCLFYEPGYYLQNPLEILQTWKGGLASHGAAIGILVALYIFSRVEHKSLPGGEGWGGAYLWLLDRMVIVVALACSLIRIGNLMNSEIFGLPTNLFWGFEFVLSPEWYRPPISKQPCHPTQIYEALAYFTIFLLLIGKYISTANRQLSIDKYQFNGLLFGIFLVSMFSVRFIIEFIKINQVNFEKEMWLNMGQLLSLPFIILGIYLLWQKNQIKKEKYYHS